MELNYPVRIVYRGFEDPSIPQSPQEQVISVDSRPMDLPHVSGYTDLVFALDGKEIPADKPFKETKIRKDSLLLVIKLKPHTPMPPEDLQQRLRDREDSLRRMREREDAVLYGCPSAAEVAGLVPESMVQPFQGFQTVEL